MSEKKIEVYLNKNDKDYLMGYLYIENVRGKELQSFEYADEWISSNKIFIDPNIELYKGRQWPNNDKNFFPIFYDSAPDRWGKVLLDRKEAYNAKKENRKTRTLMDSDYLLGVSDFARMGAIRFKLDGGDNFLSTENDIPPIKTLRELEAASLSVENEEKFEKYKLLLDPGSSLGGARPKSNVIDAKGDLWIAKFPSKNDEYDVGELEYKTYNLAKKCGLNVVDSNIMKFSKKGSTFLIKRFDRVMDGQNIKRIHFESAMALLGRYDGDQNASYLDIVSFIKEQGLDVKANLMELYKRVAFNILIKNTDDHLRNHGFLLVNNHWCLSPLYDVNINKKGTHLSLNIDENNDMLDTDILIDTSKYYEIKKDEGAKIVKEIKNVLVSFKELSINHE